MNSDFQIAIVRSGTANLASISAAFARLGLTSRIVDAPAQVRVEDAVVLPGVGSFSSGMEALKRNGWIEPFRNYFEHQKPTLAICLGLQLLCDGSEEAPGQSGLGIWPVDVCKLSTDVLVPQFGWNEIDSPIANVRSGYVYYANSFCVPDIGALSQSGWEIATTTYGKKFVAAAAKQNWLACQFHPELSGSLGISILSHWAAAARSAICEFGVGDSSC